MTSIATNTAIYERLQGDIDLNAGSIVDGSHTLEEIGQAFLQWATHDDATFIVVNGEILARS